MNRVESEFDEIIEDAISEKIAHPDDDMLIENIGIHHIELSNELSSPPQSSESTLEQERTFEEIEDSIKNSTAPHRLLTRKTLRTNKDLLDARLKLLKGFNVE